MTSMLRPRPFRALLVLALVAAAAFALTVAIPTAQAMPDVEVIYTYYSDASMTEIVGVRYWSCSGLQSWGIVTEHVERSEGLDCANYYCKDVLVDPYDPTQGWRQECGVY